jgi:type VI secretion system protein ImpA
MSDSASGPTIVDTWLEPLADGGCGADPEYDNDFQVELATAISGKAGTQFKPEGEPPNWRAARQLAEAIFERCRDVRVAIAWARAMLHLEGAATLADSLRLVHGLLERHWDTVHPVPEDGDAYARVNALNDMCSAEGLLGDLRQSLVISNRAIGELRGRDVEIALGLLEPRAEDSQLGRGQVQQMLSAAADADPALRAFPRSAKESLDRLDALMREHVGHANAPSLGPLQQVLDGLLGLMPTEVGDSGNLLDDLGIAETGSAAGSGAVPRARSSAQAAAFSGAIDSRLDALRAIDAVCEYLERTEPTNPAQLLLRRARKLVDKNFLELVREFAPQSVEEVARILGVSPDELSGSSY